MIIYKCTNQKCKYQTRYDTICCIYCGSILEEDTIELPGNQK